VNTGARIAPERLRNNAAKLNDALGGAATG
jgi:hypothetical protein